MSLRDFAEQAPLLAAAIPDSRQDIDLPGSPEAGDQVGSLLLPEACAALVGRLTGAKVQDIANITQELDSA